MGTIPYFMMHKEKLTFNILLIKFTNFVLI